MQHEGDYCKVLFYQRGHSNLQSPGEDKIPSGRLHPLRAHALVLASHRVDCSGEGGFERNRILHQLTSGAGSNLSHFVDLAHSPT